ncbi:hypothetical protein IAT40_001279 [Kwoniella sp. CBS 6097]
MSDTNTTNATTNAAGNPLPPLPKDHLDHPEQWATGAEPATEKQKGFIAVLEDKNPSLVPPEGIDKEDLGKSEASEIIEKLKSGQEVVSDKADEAKEGKEDIEGKQAAEDEKTGDKRKAPSTPTDTDNIDELDPSPAEADGKDAKESKQTTLDGAFSADAGAEGGRTKEDEEEREGEGKRTAKKPRLDDNVTTSNAESSETNGNGQTSSTTAIATAEENTNVKNGDTIPGSDAHLDHPENWATGDDPATEKQKGFIKVLEKQKGSGAVSGDVEHMGKSEASERIEELKEQ